MKFIGKILSHPTVFRWLQKRAMRTPYSHIKSIDGEQVYMYRYWLFNPYYGNYYKLFSWLPSIRLHHIMVPDGDRDCHDHPWNARTFILKNWYFEERENGSLIMRKTGDTATLKFNEFHRIDMVPEEGVWTLFITGKYRGTWGFKVDGTKIPYKEYLAQRTSNEAV